MLRPWTRCGERSRRDRTITTIVLVDDHQLVRQGMKALLEAEPDLRVIGDAADGLEALRVVERMRPLVLVLDLSLPSLSGLEVTREVTQRWPDTRVVVVSIHTSEGYVLEAFRNGAIGYVVKEASAADLVYAVREAAAGRRHLSAGMSEQAIAGYVARAKEGTLDLHETLTTREREVFQLAAEGKTSAEIAGRLGISPRTAEAHRANLMRKLGLRSQTELVRYAVRRGVLPIENDG
jgi:DNA-binding NarL/FixJ family response regulator